MNFCKILAATLTLTLTLAGTALAAPPWKAPAPGNFLVSTRVAIIEFTPQGTLVQSIVPPRPPDATSIADISAVMCSDRGELYAVVAHHIAGSPFKQAQLWIANAENTSGKYFPLPPLSHSYRTAQLELVDKDRIAVRLECDAYLVALDDGEAVELPYAECLQVAGDRFLISERDERGVSTIKVYAGETFAVENKIGLPPWNTRFAASKTEKAIYIVTGREIQKLDWQGKPLKKYLIPPAEQASFHSPQAFHNGDLAVQNRSGKIFTFDKNLKPIGTSTISLKRSDQILSITAVPSSR